ncbi:aldehyde oxidase GLOX1 [Arachis ipaensis]|uniref:Galactose oxidase-like Early set domain-containing protein n=1 Tax=Arachis hypogaea TaxID=3818 RepID=A0A445A2Z5_ARAHY|nr:aldehyde oxidase GLOX1 [Arachis ipaensis]XP_025644136.1 aldehyde oxidase GLOX1-like [Arachis hypogaea]RYR20821.1 hypothetical protein Ahy_B03g066059 [Arachis hypogaea]
MGRLGKRKEMANHLNKVFFILTLTFLFLDVSAQIIHRHPRPPRFPLPMIDIFHHNGNDGEAYNNFFKLPKGWHGPENNRFPFHPPGLFGNGVNNNDEGDDKEGEENSRKEKKGDLNIRWKGGWELINEESGVSAMHINLLPTNKILVIDAKVYRVSRLKLPEGAKCIPFRDEAANADREDCWAHAMEYDIFTNEVRPLRIGEGDPWCSSGGLSPDGTLVSTGGFFDGAKSIRHFGGPACTTGECQFREYNNLLKEERWYGTQQILANGQFIVVGGRRAFSYEFVPREEGKASEKPYFFPFLYETSDLDENNLYPFVHMIPDGNLFIFSNNRSLLLNPTTNKVLRTFPVLPGGSRNYPASGMSVLLPIDLNAAAANASKPIKAEVLMCGGNTPDAFDLAEKKKIFLPALKDCNRMVITDPKPFWDKEEMPSGRVMGDALLLPNGQVLMINGAQEGTAAWWDADKPNYTPVLYSPENPKGERFRQLESTNIARMYHSTSAVLPTGKIWVAGSNTHNTYKANDRFPTETRVEAFSPPYLDPIYARFRPRIHEEETLKEFTYGQVFKIQFSVKDSPFAEAYLDDVKVTMYYPPFTTHGIAMGQRLVVLRKHSMRLTQPILGIYRIRVDAPPSGAVAPPGYYMLSVVYRGVPSAAMWVRIKEL